MGSYKVTFREFGDETLYGYADTLGEAFELCNQCRYGGDGWCYARVYQWDPTSGEWVLVEEVS